MVGALFDTNVLIDHRNAVRQARKEIARFESRAVSIITWIEVMVGADDDLIEPIRRCLEGFKVVALDDEIADRAVTLRRAQGFWGNLLAEPSRVRRVKHHRAPRCDHLPGIEDGPQISAGSAAEGSQAQRPFRAKRRWFTVSAMSRSLRAPARHARDDRPADQR